MNIRPYMAGTHDDAAIAELLAAIYPRRPRESAEQVASFLELMMGAEFKRHLVVEDGEALIARLTLTTPWWAAKDALMLLFLQVHPAHRGKGIGRRLYKRAQEELKGRPYSEFTAKIYDDDTGSVQFATRRGLKPIMGFASSELDLSTPLSAEALAYVEGLSGQGIRFMDGHQLKAEFPDDWQHRWWRLNEFIGADVPSVDPWVEQPFEDFVKKRLAGPTFDLACWQFAMADNELIGLTGLRPSKGEPTAAGISLTGVVRTYRRRGVARALKVQSARMAQGRGIHRIVTENESANPMLALNLSLGFRIVHTESLYRGPIYPTD